MTHPDEDINSSDAKAAVRLAVTAHGGVTWSIFSPAGASLAELQEAKENALTVHEELEGRFGLPSRKG